MQERTSILSSQVFHPVLECRMEFRSVRLLSVMEPKLSRSLAVRAVRSQCSNQTLQRRGDLQGLLLAGVPPWAEDQCPAYLTPPSPIAFMSTKIGVFLTSNSHLRDLRTTALRRHTGEREQATRSFVLP